MKTRIKYNTSFWRRLFVAVVVLSFMACQENKIDPPVITGVVNYEASPNDTLVQTIQSGQWVVLQGQNLSSVSLVYFGSTPATVNSTYSTNSSIVVQVPYISFQSVPKEKWNEIIVVNEAGSVSYAINIVGPPYISYIRNFDEAPNDTVSGIIVPGQYINIIGFNLIGADSISFQGVAADLSQVVYTDSSAIIKVPDDFSGSNLSQKNKISYTTSVGGSTFTVPIEVPILVDPFLEMLTGGIGPGKTWVFDFDANGTSTYFDGPLYFSSDQLRWEYQCASEDADCWTWFPEWQTWMPAPADYGTMTFSVDANGTLLKVEQKAISANGTFEGIYLLDSEAKTLSFGDVVPLNMGSTSCDFSSAYVLLLSKDALQLGFQNKDKPEFEIYNYIPKK